MTPYGDSDVERWAPEPPKQSGRTAFERDRGRVLHSAALRRLSAKTQVVAPGESDFPRTRLTHSLECAQIGRGVALALGADPDLVEAACLAHDLGHPPFGHNGEAALDEAAAGCGGFEGNAQSFRLLTRLEPKAAHPDGRSAGLNLTRAALDAATKYPWDRAHDPRKYGVYDDDRAAFAWMRAGAPDARRCLEAQVMDWADDVAYSVHDLEDALHAGHVRSAELRDRGTRADLAAVARDRYAPSLDAGALEAALDRLQALPSWPAHVDGTRGSLAALKQLTSALVGRFCRAAEDATLGGAEPDTRAGRHGGQRRRPLARYGADLVVPDEVRAETVVLKAVAARFVMDREDTTRRYAAERAMVAELVAALADRAPRALQPEFAADWHAAADDAARLRVVVDQVAALTDPTARTLHARLHSPALAR